MSANERKRKSAKGRKRALPRKNCKRPGLKQPGLGTPNLWETCKKNADADNMTRQLPVLALEVGKP